MEERDPWLDALLFGDVLYSDGAPVPLEESPDDPRTKDPIYVIKYRSPAEMPRRQDYFHQAQERLLEFTEDLIFGFRGRFALIPSKLLEMLAD
ncbi:hypothetical protein PG994_013681 [Apiospora phragmitis]|uniref:Uncharacterized protein n=1 Tax=Apiospora phragmitis TaxID=2905665 RepID=A0ABR1T9C1_9PEZI